MDTIKISSDENGQFINLPEQFRFKGEEVHICRIGSTIILSPIENNWQTFIDSLDQFAPDFMNDRQQSPLDQESISLD